ncbi:Type II secretory pathway, ATPase PulE/Tfp pilus assembly pathway, ATPase PilB [Hyella patelloides LEGE 07179]|uniref:Type II secretory pathway, ATPase PulE/Tfp pilus assembly pathway, ATPase PilB n=1 Tax=Hyella patelloides LEGE 07179 TaxID=945734 RepID=A0A563VN91_9CYAN|nr:hypothetical protein [Hyella patelloides]VEP12920.1 Type II secretory pathway, ATPase PulE/Tfp pilus assembly pathway, ATPase PilB [Hyella patelloides LEGE 07179]
MSQFDSLYKMIADYEAVFNLIDSVFSLECCLHYQILPLELSDNHLVLGMVDPKDKKTIQHIQPLISSLDYSFHTQAIDAQTHQLVLAAYLKKGNPSNSSSNNSIQPSKLTTTSATLIDLPEEAKSNSSLNNSATLIDLPEEAKSNSSLNNSATLIDLPEEAKSNSSLNNSATLIDLPEQQEATPSAKELYERPTFIVNNKQEKITNKEEQSQIFFSEPQINNVEVTNNTSICTHKKSEQNIHLALKANYSASPLESLINLPPESLWQELLSRIVSKGIGRLYLQQHHNYGRILCCQDGIVQSSLDKVPLALFEEIIKEIKMMAKLPLTKLKKAQKVALQRYYNHERVLLRIEFLIGKLGEEITLQVLRGQALKFYEQSQADKTLDQAIYLAQKLEKSLKKIRRCQNSANVGDLSTLKAIMRQVEKQLNLLEF